MRKGFLALGLLLLSISAVPVVRAFAQLSINGVLQAPVTSVNGSQGDVQVPTLQRQISAALDIASGSVTWVFPELFANTPTCFVSLASSSTSAYVFDYPVTTMINKSQVTIAETAHPRALLVGVLFSSVAPPAGTTATLSCVASLP